MTYLIYIEDLNSDFLTFVLPINDLLPAIAGDGTKEGNKWWERPFGCGRQVLPRARSLIESKDVVVLGHSNKVRGIGSNRAQESERGKGVRMKDAASGLYIFRHQMYADAEVTKKRQEYSVGTVMRPT